VRLRDGGGNNSGGNNSGGNNSGGNNSGGGGDSGSGVENDQAVVFPYSRIVFIDSTWNQCRGIHIDQRIAGQCSTQLFLLLFFTKFKKIEKQLKYGIGWCHCGWKCYGFGRIRIILLFGLKNLNVQISFMSTYLWFVTLVVISVLYNKN
jgi:hypothetical protein